MRHQFDERHGIPYALAGKSLNKRFVRRQIMELWVALAVFVVIMAFVLKQSREWLATYHLGGYLAGLLVLFIFLAYGLTWSDLRL